MPDSLLLVSLPPHKENPDAVACAQVFGLAAGEFRHKLNFGFPEVWFGSADRNDLDAKVKALRDAGASALALEGRLFAEFPPLNQVKSFELTATGIIFDSDLGLAELTPQQSVYAVSCRPKDPGGAFNPNGFLAAAARGLILGHQLAHARGGLIGRAIATSSAYSENAARKEADSKREEKADQIARRGVPEYLAFVDFYYAQGGAIQRMTLVEGTVDYRPLGTLMKTTARENTKVLLDALQQRFPLMRVSRQMENVLYKPTAIPGRALNAILVEVSENLRNLDAYDIVSRLILLTSNPPFEIPSETTSGVSSQPTASAPSSAPIPPAAPPYVVKNPKPAPRPSRDPFAF
jgi:hypothetical protein